MVSYKTSSNFHQNFTSVQNFSYNNSKTLENYSTVAPLFPKFSQNSSEISLYFPQFFLEVFLNCFKYALQSNTKYSCSRFNIVHPFNHSFLYFGKN